MLTPRPDVAHITEVIAIGRSKDREGGRLVETTFHLTVLYDKIDGYCVTHPDLGCSKAAHCPAQAAVNLLTEQAFYFISVYRPFHS